MIDGKDPESLRFGKQKMPQASVFGPAKRRRFNLITLCFNLFVPWFLFNSLFSLTSFKMRYDAPTVVWTLVLCSLSVVIIAAVLGIRAKLRQLDPLWYYYTAFASLLAVLLAVGFGSLNFSYNMKPYFQISTLNMYTDVNVAQLKGSQLMDAGRIYFKRGTGIDMTRAMGFKSSEIYCAAPIVIGAAGSSGKPLLASYDFWAVGKNCCSGVSSDFRCGAYNVPTARAGLRLIREDERAFYRLAVQQAEAAYGIKATHPLFFEWVEDPAGEINHYQESGFQYFLVAIFGDLLFNIALVAVSIVLSAQGSIGSFT